MVFRYGQTSAVSMVLVASIVLAMVATTYQWGSPLVEKSQTNSKIVQAQNVMSMIKEKINEVALSGEQKTVTVQLAGTLEVLPEKNSLFYSVSTGGLGIGSFSYIALDGGDAVSYETYALNATTGEVARINGIDYSVAPCGVNNNGVFINGTFRNVGEAIHSSAQNYVLEHVDCSGLFDGFTVITGPEQEVSGILGSDSAGVVMAKTVVAGQGYTTHFRTMFRELDDTMTLEGQRLNITTEGNREATAGTHTITIRRGEIERVPFGSRLGKDLVTTRIYVSIS